MIRCRIVIVPEFDKIPGSYDQAEPSSRMELYLSHLTVRPSNESPAELFEDINDASTRTAVLLAPSSSYLPSPNDSDVGANSGPHNPESDSFTYIEMLLEALAVLGKLVGALDIVTQRMPTELFALVDSTVDEVSERSEFLRLTSRNGTGTAAAAGSSSASTYVYIERRQRELASLLRLTALEASAKETDRETLQDLFWTLYSKLSAVLQGFRVTYEVSDRIGKVSVCY
jgi:exocyst complex component 4